MIGSRGRKARVGIAIAIAVISWPAIGRGQTYFVGPQTPRPGTTYEGYLLKDIDVSQETLPSELSKLTRLMLLETISMHEYLRLEIGRSPAGHELQGEVDRLWLSTAIFDQMAWEAGAGMPVTTASQEAYLDLEDSYSTLRSSLGVLPGIAPFAAYRLDRVTRLFSDLRQGLPPALMVRGPSQAGSLPSGPFPEARQDAQSLAARLTDLLGVLKSSNPRGREGLAGLLDNLRALLLGFDRVLSGTPTPDDLRATYRPVLRRASEVHALVLDRSTPAMARDRWREIRQGIDDLSDRFEFPREFASRRAVQSFPPPSPPTILRLDQALAELDAFLSEVAVPTLSLLNKDRVESEAYRLQISLMRFRQEILAGLPSSQVSPAILALERGAHQIAQRIQPLAGARQGLGTARIDAVERILGELGREAAVAPSTPTP